MHFACRGSGKPLLLVHGLGSSLRNRDPIVADLAAPRDVIAVALPGFDGRTACGQFPHWDQSAEAARLILESTA